MNSAPSSTGRPPSDGRDGVDPSSTRSRASIKSHSLPGFRQGPGGGQPATPAPITITEFALSVAFIHSTSQVSVSARAPCAGTRMLERLDGQGAAGA